MKNPNRPEPNSTISVQPIKTILAAKDNPQDLAIFLVGINM